MKYLALAIPAIFLFLASRYAGAAPCAGCAAALLVWYLDPREAPRGIAWGATAVGVVVGLFREGPMLLAGALIAIGALIALELFARRGGGEDPSATSVLIAALFVASSGWYLTTLANPFKSIGEVRNIVAFGDSLTSGVPGDGVSRRWPEALAARLGGEAINLSYPGDTTAESWERWQSRVRARQWSDKPGWSPDLYVIMLGGNEIRQSAAPASIEAGLKIWLDELARDGKPILLVAVPGAPINDPYRDVWRRAAEGQPLANWMPHGTLRTIFTSPRMTMEDRIHFRQPAHDYLAGAIADRIAGK